MEIIENLFKLVGTEIISFCIGLLLTNSYINRKYIKIWIMKNFKSKKIRISAAYLFRIVIDNKYLLVKNPKISNQYQPIGGVYKYFSSFSKIYNEYEITTEKNSLFFEEGDLRVYVKNNNVVKFIKWFKKGENREINVIREFVEEVVEKGILTLNSINEIEIEFIK